uniref:Selenoprotein O n=1 Tax=Pseudictyota dubia TaxID=2749911 RepID=A0A7R9W7P8_9STRA|mmetsp:Transcript_36622/g.67773  ORF Transcript_36622/g.67773 Transcript_36622/m.67773 type:complete len:415 (+) Transcript_36622:1-1245(+)
MTSRALAPALASVNWSTMMAILAFVAALSASPSRVSAFGSVRAGGLARCKPSLATLRLLSDDAGDDAAEEGISRLSTLRTLLSTHGAPGSRGCKYPDGDLVPADGDSNAEERLNLHPHLYPIARSSKTGHYVCALRRAYADDAEYDSSTGQPWPIVESESGGPGMRLLALNSEHLMRRIAAEADDSGDKDGVVDIYNDGLGEGKLKDAGLDTPYEAGSVEKLGYGLEKYTLLRVGPFPDLYAAMARQHAAKGDEQSSLIAAEASNGKFTGFGSTFAFYARLLASLPQREEEAKDAARMCLRLPIPSMGLDLHDFAEVARLAGLADEDDSEEEAMAKMQVMYEKIRDHEKEDDQAQAQMTPEQMAIDDANYLLDTTAFKGGKWADIRSKLGEIYLEGGKDEMAQYVNPSRTYTLE